MPGSIVFGDQEIPSGSLHSLKLHDPHCNGKVFKFMRCC